MEAASPLISTYLWFLQLVMGLGGPAVAPAPDVTEVERYAVQDSTHFVYLHLGAVLPNGHTFLKGLADVPAVRDTPDLKTFVTHQLSQLDSALQGLRETAGLDVLKDLEWLSIWIRYDEDGQAEGLLVVRGDFAPSLLKRIGGGEVATLAGYPTLRELTKPAVVTQVGENVLLLGREGLVQKALTASSHTGRGRLADELPTLLEDNPRLILASVPSEASRKAFSPKTTGLAARLLEGFLTKHRFASLSLGKKGLRWAWQTDDVSQVDDARRVSEGLLDLLRASHLLLRGFGRVSTGLATELLREASPRERNVILNHHESLLQLLFNSTGDGHFEAQAVVDRANATVRVEARGQNLHEVFPSLWLSHAALALVGQLTIAAPLGTSKPWPTPTP